MGRCENEKGPGVNRGLSMADLPAGFIAASCAAYSALKASSMRKDCALKNRMSTE